MAEISIPIRCDADIVTARQKGRELASACGFSSTQQTMLATAISELARNILTYAGTGEVRIVRLPDSPRKGISVVAQDQGPGIADPEMAMRDGYSTSKSLGLGLPGARRIMDEFELTSRPGMGTTVRMTKWL